ncbi:MAG: GspH/FimT family pseudopilin [Pirellulales bacterium]
MHQTVFPLPRLPRAGVLRRGHTLVEMTIVVLIIGIAAAAGTPMYLASINRYRTDAAASRIASDLAYAKRQALANSADAVITFSPSTETYAATNMQSLDRTATNFTVNLSQEPYQVDLVSANFGGSQSVTFNRYGAPSAAGLVVVGGNGYQKTITVNATSGRATIQ